ncbi:MAG TPA: ATP-binding cassette domain-containing protein [Magnetospirillaceae bacterium]|jgi:ATP-binding cassette subfamily F protein uup
MPPAAIIALRDAAVTFGGRPTFAHISVAMAKGERVCLVGRNGGGKSTLLKALAGQIDVDAGEVFRQPGARVAYLPQEFIVKDAMDVATFVTLGLNDDERDQRYRVDAALDEVQLLPGRMIDTLSGGERRRAWIARALVGEPDALLLDEPTNHLDIAMVEWLEERLSSHPAGILTISHDRTFLRRLSRRTLWLDRGVLREHDQGYASFDEWSEAILTAEAAEQHRLDRRIVSETQWAREGISARRKRNQGRVRRLGELRQDKAQRIKQRDVKLGPVGVEASGRLVIEMEHVAKHFDSDDGEKVIAKDFTTRVMRSDRVGLIGRNGAGKSTLLGLMLGSIAPDSGEVRQGANLMPVLFDQHRAQLDPDLSLWETLAGEDSDTVYVQGKAKHVAAYLKDFLFEDRQYRAKVSTLSGGERNRLLLAKILAQPSNLLVLDEPTNDLDMETLDLLEELLADYEGTLLLVSHDRDFLDRLVTSTIAVEGNGVIEEYVGGYSDYLRQHPAPASIEAKKAAAPASRPKDKASTRLSYNEQRELSALPEKIAALEQEKAKLETAMANPASYGGDHTKLAAAAARHGEVVDALSAAEEKWLMLAERAEQAKG